MHSPFVEMIRTVIRPAVRKAATSVAVDPVTALHFDRGACFFYLSNSATLALFSAATS